MTTGKGELYIERRKHKRVEKKYTVSYKVITSSDEVQEIKKSTIRASGESTDISLGGVKVEGEVAGGRPDDIIRVEISVDDDKEPITTFAEIKWVREEQGGRKSFGLEFLILKDSDKELINSIIERD